jgi:hypothetical protein
VGSAGSRRDADCDFLGCRGILGWDEEREFVWDMMC